MSAAKPTRGERKLLEEIAGLKRAADSMIATHRQEIRVRDELHQTALGNKDKAIFTEQQQRVAAQRGLVPYVRALEQLDKWLLGRPAQRKKLEPILRELGLWEIKLGYDPHQDLGLSAISPRRK